MITDIIRLNTNVSGDVAPSKDAGITTIFLKIEKIMIKKSKLSKATPHNSATPSKI